MFLKSHHMAAGLALLISAASAQAAPPKVGDTFGNWLFECQALAANKTACVLSQTLSQAKTKQRVLRVTLNKPENSSEFQLVAVAPLGIHIPTGVTGSVDKSTPIPFGLKTCTKQGCIAVAKANNALIKALKSGKNIEISFTANPRRKPVSLNVSLTGITAGINALERK
jgi:invasion protein IalB